MKGLKYQKEVYLNKLSRSFKKDYMKLNVQLSVLNIVSCPMFP